MNGREEERGSKRRKRKRKRRWKIENGLCYLIFKITNVFQGVLSVEEILFRFKGKTKLLLLQR